MRRLVSLFALVTGCTVGPTPPAAHDAGCEPIFPPSTALGPHADRLRCAPPPLRFSEAPTPEQLAFAEEIETLATRFCDQERARVSVLPEHTWQRGLRGIDGGVYSIEGRRGALELALPTELVLECDPIAQARGWLERHAPLVALDAGGELVVDEVGSDGVLFRHLWHGLPIGNARREATVRVHLGVLYRANGFTPSWRLPPTHVPTVSATDATSLAGSEHAPRLMVWIDAYGSIERRLAWVFPDCVVDALDGTLHECF